MDEFRCRYLAKILIPEGSKDVAVGKPIALIVSLLVQKYIDWILDARKLFNTGIFNSYVLLASM